MSIGEDRTQEMAAAEPKVQTDRLAAVRSRAQAIARDKTMLLLVPGYEGMVGIRYHGIASGELDKFVQRAMKASESGKLMDANADLLIRCCQAILVRDGEAAEWQDFDLDSDEPTTFSTATLPELLPEFIGGAKTAREEVFGLFSPGGSQGMAVGQHSDAVINWLQGNAEQIDKALLGE